MSYQSLPKWRRQLRYRAYLETEYWRDRRKRILKKAGYRCRKCGDRATMVHHERYRRWGRERDSDLTALCKFCHTKLHT